MIKGLVSVIMPSWNTGRFIAESIQSVIAQTYTNWELLIVDDCSSDNTDDVIANFHDKRIFYFKNEKKYLMTIDYITCFARSLFEFFLF